MKLDENYIQRKRDKNYTSGFGCDSKWVGNFLEEIFEEMRAKNIKIIPELLELKQYLRFKGGAKIDQGDYSLWNSVDGHSVNREDNDGI